MSAMPVILLLLATMLDPVPAGPAPQRSRPWNFSIAGGIGLREVGSEGFGVPYVAFWAAQERSPKLELVYEGFALTPTTVDDVIVVRDVGFGFLVRLNYYFRDGFVRPYLTIGGGVVLQRRVNELPELRWSTPDGIQSIPARSDREDRLGINSVVGFGVRVRLSDRMYLRPEARIPVPFLPPANLGHPLSSVALAVGVTYSPGDG